MATSTTTTKSLNDASDSLRNAINNYHAAIGPELEREVPIVAKHLAAADAVLALRPRKGTRPEVVSYTQACADEARELVATFSPEKVAQSLRSQAARIERAKNLS